jgi:serine protease Do
MRRAAALLAVLVLLLAVPPSAVAEPRWGWLGVRIRDLSEQEMDEISRRHGLREGFGALIVEVLEDTPAARAGLRQGDIVVAIRERPVVDTRTLQRAVGQAPVGEALPVTVLRRGEGRHRLEVTVGRMPDRVAAERVGIEFGFVVRDPETQPPAVPPRPAGSPAAATVAVVVPRSRAEAAGLKPGDVLVEINGTPVKSLEAVRAALLAAPLDAPLRLVVGREHEQVTLLLAGPGAR